MNDFYLQKLIQEIRNLELLQNKALFSGKWKNAGFIALSELVAKKLDKVLTPEQHSRLGTTISYKTLTNIFKGYKKVDPTNKNALNTLNKLAIFANFKDWNDFTATIDKQQTDNLTNTPPEEVIEFLIRKAMAMELQFYKKLPSFHPQLLSSIFVTNESAFHQISNTILLANKNNWTLANDSNPSENDLLACSIEQLTPTTAKVITQESWTLCWWHSTNEQYTHSSHKKISDHTYLVEKIGNEWKIKTHTIAKNIQKIPSIKNTPRSIPSTDTEQNMKTLITKAMKIEFDLYKQLPAFQPELLHATFFDKEAAFKEIFYNLLTASKRNWTIDSPHNPSSKDLIDCSIKQINATTAQVLTKESWSLWWWHILEQKMIHVHKAISTHTYLLEKIGDQWKIKTNASDKQSLKVPL